MNDELLKAKQLLQATGYIVARRAKPGWQKEAWRFRDNYVAFPLRGWRYDRETMCLDWVKPKEFCEVIGITRKTLTKSLKDKSCPKVKVQRGKTGRLRSIQPSEELIRFLLRNK